MNVSKSLAIPGKRRWKFLLLVLSSFYALELCAQSKMKILAEPNSGMTWTRTERIYNPGPDLNLYTSTFKHSNYTGIGLSLERRNLAFGLNYRLQSIQYTDMKYYSWDTFTVLFKTKLFILSPKVEYSIVNTKHILSKLQFAYSIPARTRVILYKIKRTDNDGNIEILDNFWYQRTGAYYGGINFSYRSTKDRYRAGLNLGAERLRRHGKSFGEWFQQHDASRWYYMAGINLTYTCGLKKKKK